LFSIEGEDGGIEVEEKRGRRPRFQDQPGEKPLVEFAQLQKALGRQSEQETAQGSGIGIRRESREILEDPIALE